MEEEKNSTATTTCDALAPHEICKRYNHRVYFDEPARSVISFLYHVQMADTATIRRAVRENEHIGGKLKFLREKGVIDSYAYGDKKVWYMLPEVREEFSHTHKKGNYIVPRGNEIKESVIEAGFLSVLKNPYTAVYKTKGTFSYAVANQRKRTFIVAAFTDRESYAAKFYVLLSACGGDPDRYIVCVFESGMEMEYAAKRLCTGADLKRTGNILFTSIGMLKMPGCIPVFEIAYNGGDVTLNVRKI